MAFLLPKPFRWAARVASWGLALVLGGLLVVAWFSRSMRDLALWHEEAPREEFQARDARAGFEFASYLDLEERLFAGLARYAVQPDELAEHSRFSRYVAGGPHDPARSARNWNRSFEFAPSEPRGGFLLVHGLSDSPYSLRSLAELLFERGYYVLGLRLPGHGTVPAGLLRVRWQDWRAAVRIAMREVARRSGPGNPLGIAGYSCGGALSLDYVLDALEDPSLARPERVILISPAIGVTAFARMSNWHRAWSWIPGFEKSRWLDIDPELDPYKYNSFTKNAGRQMWELAGRVRSRLADLQAAGRTRELPPVLALQSVVDSTIVARELFTGLFDRLPANGSELVLFDLNRAAKLEGLYSRDHAAALREAVGDEPLSYRITVVTNTDASSTAVEARTWQPGERRPRIEALGLEWPPLVYSLSHVALPFPPDDPTYGVLPRAEDGELPLLGNLMLRGENGVLALRAEQLMRLRHNPFHSFLKRVVIETLLGER